MSPVTLSICHIFPSLKNGQRWKLCEKLTFPGRFLKGLPLVLGQCTPAHGYLLDYLCHLRIWSLFHYFSAFLTKIYMRMRATYLFLVQNVRTWRPFWRLSSIDSIFNFRHSFGKFFIRKWFLDLILSGWFIFLRQLFENLVIKLWTGRLNLGIVLFYWDFIGDGDFNGCHLNPLLVGHVGEIYDWRLPIIMPLVLVEWLEKLLLRI